MDVTLNPSPENDSWSFFSMLSTSPIDKLVNRIRLGFRSEIYTAFNIELISTHSESTHLQSLNIQLNQLTKLYPVMRIISHGKKDLAELLFIAAQNGDIEVVKALLVNPIDHNQAMLDGTTPLYTAILFGHFEVAQMLLQHSSIAIKNPTLIPATQKNYDELVQVILSNEASRTYYLKQIILKPELMQNALKKLRLFLKHL